MLKKTGLLAAALLVAAAALPNLVCAQETPFSVRIGATRTHFANDSDGGGPANLPSNIVDVSNVTFPEIDLYYKFTPNIVAQLVLTYPQKSEVTVAGPFNGADIGSFKWLPPSLVAQWHFLPGQTWDPYVGAGVNFTWVTSVNLDIPGVGTLDLKKTSWGAVAEVGLDYNVDKRWYVNAEFKYIDPLQSDVTLYNGTKITTAKLNPMLYSIGVGYHF